MNTARYSEIRPLIRDGDLLLFRRRGWIAAAGRGWHSHAAKAAWWGKDLFLLEVLQFAGGRAVRLSTQVRQWPGRYDLYTVNPSCRWPMYDRAEATRYMKLYCGCDYGYWSLAMAALLHLPVVRRWINPEKEDRERPPFCSHACAMADRVGGGVDPVKHLADRLTEPADLARSPFYRYRFTLVP